MKREQAGLSRSWELAILLFFTAVAACLRLFQLTEVPPGLHFDEAFKGVMARGLLQGGPFPLFFAGNQGEEALATYLAAVVLALGNGEAWTLRLPPAIIGTLTVPMAWWLGRGVYRLARRGASDEMQPVGFGAQAVGLGSAGTLAILYWHVSLSRLGMQPVLVPFFMTITFAAILHGLNRDNYAAYALAGLALGAGLYTYKAGYLVPVVVALFLLYSLVVERGFLGRHWRGLLLLTVVAVGVALPLALYFAGHPADFLQRFTDLTAAEASESEKPWQTAVDNIPAVLGMFFIEGDANPRSNLPGRPALDPFLALLFLVGLGRAVAGFRRPALILPLIWLGVMVLPTLVTSYAPHFPRAIGAVPAVALLCALGGWTLWQGASRLDRRWARGMAMLLAAGLTFSGISTAWAYFGTWRSSPDLYYAYDEGLVRIAEYANTIPATERVYVTPTRGDHYTLRFLIERSFTTFDGRAGLVLPPPGQAATYIVVVQADAATGPALGRLRPDATVARSWTDEGGQPYATAYHAPAAEYALPQPGYASGAVLGESAELMGAVVDDRTVAPGDTLYLTLFWRALAPVDQDYTVFVHLLGEYNPATSGPVWAGHDGKPVAGRYVTTAWQAGEVILDTHPLAISADAPPGEYRLEAGLYLLQTMARSPARDPSGNLLPESAVTLGTVTVGD